MLICSFKDEAPDQQTGHYLIAEKKQYGQMLRIMYSVTGMFPIITEMGFMETDLDNNRQKTKWCVLTESDITGEEYMYGIGASLKVLSDKEISTSYTTLAFALKPNRPELISSKGAYHAQFWGLLDDVDEENLVNQVQTAFPEQKDRASIGRKIYRQRVASIPSWDDINNDKFTGMAWNQIPQKFSKLDQLLNHNINDSWNEPSIIQVLIIHQETAPTELDFSLDIVDENGQYTTLTATLMLQDQHPELPFNWQFGIDREAVHHFMHCWTNLKR